MWQTKILLAVPSSGLSCLRVSLPASNLLGPMHAILSAIGSKCPCQDKAPLCPIANCDQAVGRNPEVKPSLVEAEQDFSSRKLRRHGSTCMLRFSSSSLQGCKPAKPAKPQVDPQAHGCSRQKT